MTGPSIGVDPDAARAVAERILADPRYHPRRGARPLAGFFRRMGELVVDPVLRVLRGIGDHLPDVGTGPWFALAALVVLAGTVITARLSGSRSRRRFPVTPGPGAARAADPAELERRSDDAELRGDLDGALRLRFRAGLGRLDQAGAVQLRPGLTNAAVSRVLRSPRFDALVGDFDEIAYGGRRATAHDVATARAGWPLVMDAARAPVDHPERHPGAGVPTRAAR